MKAAAKPKNRIDTNGHAKPSETVAAPAPAPIELRPLDKRTFSFELKGVTPLVVNRLGESVRAYLEDRDGKKSPKNKGVRDPQAEFRGSLYVFPGTGEPGTKDAVYGLPASGFKKAAVRACTYLDGVAMTWAKGAFFVHDDGNGYVKLKYKELVMREDVVRLQGMSKAPELRYRGEFRDWSVRLRILYNAGIISQEQIVTLFQYAGFHVGWGEMRPEKGYSNGMFEPA